MKTVTDSPVGSHPVDEILSEPVATPGITDGHGLTFPELWAFLNETGFVYPEKRASLAPLLPQIERTLGTLLGRRNPLLKTLVARREGRLQGHISAVRAYTRTGIAQHLAVRQETGNATLASDLSVSLLEHFEDQLPETEWGKIYFRPENRWPAHVFGSSARSIEDREASDLRTYRYLVGSTVAPSAPPPAGVTLRPAEAAHFREVAAYFVERRESVAIQAEDLHQEGLSLETVSRNYRDFGLERRREILVAERVGRLVGVALLDVASYGLNFSELTNTFKVHVPEGDAAVTRALIAAARNRYGVLGRPLCFALAVDPILSHFEAVGFVAAKSYSCWTFHRSVFRQIGEHIRRLCHRRAFRKGSTC